MIRFNFFLDYGKEEAWLNEMARSGYELVDVLVWYTFRRCEPQDTLIRIDNRMFRSKTEFLNYCTLFEDSGWKHIAGSAYCGTQYFRRMTTASREDIFSDQFSRAERFKRLAQMWISLAFMMLGTLVGMAFTGPVNLSAVIHPRLFYLTPGLWERSGAHFWSAFWFETPFALFRALPLYLLPILLILYLFCAFKSYRYYLKGKSNEA